MFTKNISLIFFSALGISATFMPWLHYPKENGVIYGYLLDGIVTGFVFFLILLYAIFTLRKIRFKIIPSIFIGILGLLMAILSYSNIIQIEAEKLNSNSENPMIASATAGFHQGIGIYIFGIAGIGIFITILLAIFFQNSKIKKYAVSIISLKSRPALKYIFGILIILVASSTLFYIKNKNNTTITADSLRPKIKEDINNMGLALINGDYDAFVKYNHPVMIQSYGGKEKTISLIQAAMEELKSSGTTIKDVSFADIYDIEYRANSIQAIIAQQVIFTINGQDKKEIQKMIAVSDDGGAKWHFLNINGKTKAEMLKFFPELNPNLKF